MTQHKCARCKTASPHLIINERRTLKSGAQSISYYCRPCTRERTKKYYHANKESVRAGIYRSIRKHPEKQRARVALNYQLKKGTMKRPGRCQDCGKVCKPHGHHEDYSKPLEVEWLCTSCHADRHPEHRASTGRTTFIS